MSDVRLIEVEGPVTGVAFSPDGSSLYACVGRSVLRLDARTLALSATFVVPDEDSAANCVAVHESGIVAVGCGGEYTFGGEFNSQTADYDSTVRILTADKLELVRKYGELDKYVQAVCFDAHGRVVARSHYGMVLFAYPESPEAATRKAALGHALCADPTRRALVLAAGVETENTLELIASGQDRACDARSTGPLTLDAVAASHDWIAAAGRASRVLVLTRFDPSRGRLLGEPARAETGFGAFEQSIRSLAFNPAGDRLAVAGARIHVLGMPQAKLLAVLPHWAYQVAYSPDGTLAWGQSDAIGIWKEGPLR